MLRRLVVPFASSALLVLAVVCDAGCGGAASPVAPTDAVRTPAGAGAGPAPIAAAAPSGPRRGASDALKKAWAFDSPKVVVYADFRGLVRTTVMSALAKGVVAMMATVDATPVQKKCVEDVLANVQEVAFGSDGDASLLVARVDPAATAWVGPCMLGAFPGTKPTTIAGASDAWVNRSDVTAVSAEGLVFLGVRASVERGLAGRSTGASLAAVTLGAGEYVAWNATMFENMTPITGAILVTDERFRVSGEGDVPSVKVAEQVEKELDTSKLGAEIPAKGLKSDEVQALQKIVKAFSVKRDGRHLAIAFELREAPAEQARDLGAAAALGIYGVRKYIINAKQAEARNVLGQLAKDVISDWEGERPDGKPRSKKKLVSFPAVPKTVPKGVKYQSSEADWKPWAPIRFELSVPQYYQYEIKAAKDGESAEIIARGDLNGDGKTSQFKLLIKVDRTNDSLRAAPSIAETDPDE